MYLTALTTSDVIASTTYVYLHHTDRRMQLSHTIDREVMHETLDDARHALALAEDFCDDVFHGVYTTITGPDGMVESHYRGIRDENYKAAIIARHNHALAGYGITAEPPAPAGLDAALAQFTYANMYRDAR